MSDKLALVDASASSIDSRLAAFKPCATWSGKGESRAQWDLIRSAVGLMQGCDDRDYWLSGFCD